MISKSLKTTCRPFSFFRLMRWHIVFSLSLSLSLSLSPLCLPCPGSRKSSKASSLQCTRHTLHERNGRGATLWLVYTVCVPRGLHTTNDIVSQSSPSLSSRWRMCALRRGIQNSMEAIWAYHPALSTEWLG